MIGRIINILPSGYGFIADEDGTRYFFHFKQYLGDWDYLKRVSPPHTNKGPVVQFKPILHAKGLRGEQVQLLGDL